MRASDKCISIIESCEGFSSKPYLCPAGIPTIGYGSTRYPSGVAVSLKDPEITKETAIQMVFATLATEYEAAVNRYVQVPINQNQFDALVDFAYNCGVANLKSSSLLKFVNAKDFKAAAAEFNKWIYGGGKILPGLVKRRNLEKDLFLS